SGLGMSSPRQKRQTASSPLRKQTKILRFFWRALSMWNFNFIPFKYLFYHFMKTLPLALDALLCIGALLVPAFLASCREASERQDQIRFGLFPNVTHVQGLVARHFSRTGEGWFEKRIFERTGKNISILWYAYNAGPS